MTKRLVDAVHDHRELVARSASRLNALASAMRTLGMMESTIKVLWDVADSLEDSASELSLAYNEDLTEKVEHSKNVAHGMLALALHAAVPK